jgi:hypothetical protein
MDVKKIKIKDEYNKIIFIFLPNTYLLYYNNGRIDLFSSHSKKKKYKNM